MIRIQNVYYMMAYAFQCLNEKDEKQYSGEEFDYVVDMFALILLNGITRQIKRGLFKNYITYQEELSFPRGRICLSDTINKMARQQKIVVCDVDEYIENTYANQILKTVILLLIKCKDVRDSTRRKLKKYLPYFQQVDETDLAHVSWRRFTFTRNSSSYRMMMNICHLIVDGMIVGDGKNNQYRLKEYVDDQKMHALYEKFIFEYYKKHYSHLKISRSQIEWNVDDDNRLFLPKMKSDIMIEYKAYTLIIDAKYYEESLKTNRQYGNKTIHSNNLYQIYTYVKNKDRFSEKRVSGILLYANVEGSNPDVDYMMDGNRISVKTLDLDCNFDDIKSQLNKYIDRWISYVDSNS